ncbi:universal stress protein [Phenylobacterium sp. J367]|uniref:universal stress protein n=1 Tax=Phenylobacterium sp. J367 TaxID=2898435 RepID=UPI0021511120|nr:universal stress protein [Phenylobacterium sp. J367]MCR5880019.1 universal stress protein [Phenylobacterium sp. J367]
MSWARIMAPLSGGQGDPAAVAAAVMLAEPFGAEVACVYTPADVADVMPWMGEGFLGGVQTTALESLKEAAAAGEKNARAAMAGVPYAKSQFVALQTPVWAGLSAESRLSDVVVFNSDPARGRGPLAEAFQQMVADEQRPVLIAREGFKVGGTVAVAWDGGKEASRAARLAVPLLEKAQKVVILGAPKASSRTFDPARLQAYYATRGVTAELQVLSETGDAAPALLKAAKAAGAEILVAGAFGHPRLQEFIFGGTTRTLLNSDQPSLFLSH